MEPEQQPTQSTGGSKYIIGLVIAAVIVVGVSLASVKKSNQVTPTEQTPVVATSTTTSTETPKTFTLAEVATHNNDSSCYSAIRGSVYDLTSWIYKHPGGSARILSICGKDGTSAFTTQHAGEPRPEAMLASFKIGELAK
ncbi:MAG: cytochrome b5-like heme/steroid binding domain-containing protein [Patescibacteria group bacterium]